MGVQEQLLEEVLEIRREVSETKPLVQRLQSHVEATNHLVHEVNDKVGKLVNKVEDHEERIGQLEKGSSAHRSWRDKAAGALAATLFLISVIGGTLAVVEKLR